MNSKFRRAMWGKNEPTKANKYALLTCIFVGLANFINPHLNSLAQGIIVFGGLGALALTYFWERKSNNVAPMKPDNGQ